ncbi:MAG: hypothetical protein GY829_10110 [Gammaproteobacteria bacterium]|nr:hypothetical protein [Gammaproteobacteria bacterium]
MNTDNNSPTDIAEHSIVRQARMLNEEIEPETDLWPKIAEQIRDLPQVNLEQSSSNQSSNNSWMPMAVAASMFIAVGALGFAGYINYSVQQQEESAIVDTLLVEEQSTVELIEQPFMVARTSYLTALVTQEQQMSPEVRDVLKKNLTIIDAATREIRQALKENPDDPFLTEALLLTRQKELALLNQVTSHGPDTI